MNDVASMNAPESGQGGTSRRRKGCLYWLGRGVLVAGLLLIALVVVSAGIEAVVARRDRISYLPPGQLTDIGGYMLHIHCVGDGSPTVILESGAGEASPMWGWIQPQLAAVTRVCAYDRAGFGWSDAGPEPRHAGQIVTELHTLLGNTGIQPPYLLVGHSLGGELVRLFTGKYPDEVAGVVLIDSSHPDQLQRMPEIQAENALNKRLNQAGMWAAPLGLMRLYWGDGGPNPTLPPQASNAMRAFFATARPYRTMQAEDLARPQTDEHVRAIDTLGALPLIVLSQDTTGGWMSLQEELSRLSSNSQWRVIEGASHMGLLTEEHYATQTSAAIQQLVESVREAAP